MIEKIDLLFPVIAESKHLSTGRRTSALPCALARRQARLDTEATKLTVPDMLRGDAKVTHERVAQAPSETEWASSSITARACQAKVVREFQEMPSHQCAARAARPREGFASASLSPADFLSFGWRIPFVFSAVLVAVGLYIRLKVSETPPFEALEKAEMVAAGSPIGDAIRFHWRPILRWMFFFCGPAAIFYLIVVYSLSYVTRELGVPTRDAFALLMGANVCAIVGAMAGGLLSDRIGRRSALAVGSVATLVILFIYFPMLETRSFPVMLAAMGAFLGFTQFQSGIQPVAFAEAFPTNVRYSGSALAYTGANLIAGVPMPVLAAWLVGAANGSPWGVVALCAGWNILSLAMILTAPDRAES